MEFVSRLTEHSETPGTFETAFSTRALQAAQLIPVTLYLVICIRSFRYKDPQNMLQTILRLLFHQFLKNIDKFIDDLFLALADIARNAGMHMPPDKLAVKGVDSGIDRSRLH